MYALFKSAEWWVVYVRSEGQPCGAVYGGFAATVHRLVREHADWAGPIAEMSATPYSNGHDSLVARVELEKSVYAGTAA